MLLLYHELQPAYYNDLKNIFMLRTTNSLDNNILHASPVAKCSSIVDVNLQNYHLYFSVCQLDHLFVFNILLYL
jgi:hypothetical protein